MRRKTRYYIDRLKVMSLAEICHSVKVHWYAAVEHNRLSKDKSEWSRVDICKELILKDTHPNRPHNSSEDGTNGFTRGNRGAVTLAWEQFRTGKINSFYFDANAQGELLHWYKKKYVKELAAVLERANELCDHVIPIFGRRFNFTPTIPWHRDPITHNEWPQIYYAAIDLKDGNTIGGVKWVWELNRHQHLVTLGKAFSITGEERYAQEVCSQICHWIKTNPPLIGVNWASSLEIAIRILSWLWALHFIRTSKALEEIKFCAILQSIYEQTRFIETHLSAFSSANNHLVGEAAALATVGLTIPLFRRSREWIEKGLNILRDEIEKQVHPDGVSAEQSVHYGIFSTELWLGVLLLARKAEIDVARIWYERLEKVGEFVMLIMDSAGNVPQIGDNDGGCAYWLCESVDFNEYRSLLSRLAVVCERADFKENGKQFDEKSFWLLGMEGFRKYERLTADGNSLGSRAFVEGGYYILRSKESILVFDCGNIGYTNHAAHGHADALSVTLSMRGKPVLVDPGMPCYHENPVLRDAFRGTSAHNTIVVDGKNQSRIADNFLWLRKANAMCNSWTTSSTFDSVGGIHDGYRQLGVMHRRHVTFVRPDIWLIIDTLNGAGTHQVEQYWHLAAEAEVSYLGDLSARISREEIVLDLIVTGPKNLSLEMVSESENSANGWISPHYGKLSRAPVLCYRGSVSLPCTLTTLFTKR